MKLKTWTKGVLTLFALLFLFAGAFPADAWARAGGGGSMGSRGSGRRRPRGAYTPPSTTRPSTTPTPGVSPTRPLPRPPPRSPAVSGGASAEACWDGLAGGLLFRSFFGGPQLTGAGPAAGGGGIGLFDILLLIGIGYLIYWYVKKKRQEATATEGYYQSTSVEPIPQAQYPPAYDQPPVSADARDLELGLANIRQFDQYFDPAAFQDLGMDVFFKIQGAWANRDMSSVRSLLTDEMYRILQGDADRLKAAKRRSTGWRTSRCAPWISPRPGRRRAPTSLP